MKTFTPRGVLSKAHGDVFWAIRRIEKVARMADASVDTRNDAVEVEKVLRVVLDQVYRMLGREREYSGDSRFRRPGSDLALKAQLAKARQAVAEVLNEREDGPSHK